MNFLNYPLALSKPVINVVPPPDFIYFTWADNASNYI